MLLEETKAENNMFTCLIHIGATSSKSVSVVDIGQKVEYEHENGLVQCSASSEINFQKKSIMKC